MRAPGRLEQSRRDHQRIPDALLAGDPAAARRVTRSHIQGARTAASSTPPQQAGADGQR